MTSKFLDVRIHDSMPRYMALGQSFSLDLTFMSWDCITIKFLPDLTFKVLSFKGQTWRTGSLRPGRWPGLHHPSVRVLFS